MSDDLFIREVDEELRQDKLKTLWRRYGLIIIGGATAIILTVAGVVGYDHWRTSQASASGDRFLTALNAAESGDTETAIAELDALAEDGFGSYPLLARLRMANETAKTDPAAAIAAYDAIAADTSAQAPLRDLARVRAAYLLVDHGAQADVAERAEPLTGASNPWRFSALEALGLAAFKAGDLANALQLFEQLTTDAGVPPSLQQRAAMMVELLKGRGVQASAG